MPPQVEITQTGSKAKRLAQGRMLKPHPPPTAGEADGCRPGPLVLADDLTRMADHAGLPLQMPVGDLQAEAERIGDAFETYSIFNRTFGRIAPEAKQRDWCKVVAQQACDLLLALGHLDDARLGSGSLRFRDGMQTLGQHWPGRRTGGKDHQLERQAWRLDPQRMQAERLNGEDGVDGVFWDFMHQKMPAALTMLELLARTAAERYAEHVKHGGRKGDGARKGLFRDLAGSHERLFGALPAIGQDAPPAGWSDRDNVPAGPSLDWFENLLATMRGRALKLGRLPSADGASRTELDPQYAVIVALAERYLDATKHADNLAKAIRAGSKAWLAQPEPEPDDPDHQPPSVEEIFGTGGG